MPLRSHGTESVSPSQRGTAPKSDARALALPRSSLPVRPPPRGSWEAARWAWPSARPRRGARRGRPSLRTFEFARGGRCCAVPNHRRAAPGRRHPVREVGPAAAPGRQAPAA